MELRFEVGGLLEVMPPRPLIDGAMDGVAAVSPLGTPTCVTPASAP